MSEEDKLYLIVRFLAAVAGLFSGAIVGTIVAIAHTILFQSTFGLTRVWPGTATGAAIGVLLGFIFPRTVEALIQFFARVRQR